MTFDEWYTSITIEHWDHKALMMRAWEAATKNEREACAKACEETHKRRVQAGRKTGYNAIIDCVDAIRAR